MRLKPCVFLQLALVCPLLRVQDLAVPAQITRPFVFDLHAGGSALQKSLRPWRVCGTALKTTKSVSPAWDWMNSSLHKVSRSFARLV
jgi:hypothetical protein